MNIISSALPERFLSKTEYDDISGCTLWTACVTGNGYGAFRYGGKMEYAHRIAYSTANGEIPKELEIDHLCSNRLCVNPGHLEAVTHAVNVSRGNAGKPRRNKTHCVAGHPYSGDNLYVVPATGARKCRTCVSSQNAARYIGKKRGR